MSTYQTPAFKENILIVDDTPDNLRLLSAMLQSQGYQVRKAISGKLALQGVQIAKPNLILLDVNMPDMNGYEVCEQLKLISETREIPVIFISALDNVLDKVKAFEVGAVDYITKPFQVEEVLARVQNQLNQQRLSQKIQEQNKQLQAEITERKRIEEALRQSETYLAAAQRVAHIGNWGFDLLSGTMNGSEELFNIFGLDPTESELNYVQHLQQILPDDRALVQQAIEQMLTTGKSYQLDYRIVRPDGEIRYVEGRGEAVVNEQGQALQLFGTVMDITARKQAEEAMRQSEAGEREKAIQLAVTLGELKRTQTQLIHTEKMSSLGRMIAGVAHEINNPVSFIYGNLALAREYFQDLLNLIGIYQQTYPNPTPELQQQMAQLDLEFLVGDWQKLMNSMQVGAERICQIVQSLKSFSRLDESELKSVNIHDGIDDTLLILEHRLRAVGDRAAIKVIKNYGQLPKIICYASQLNQVFMNLLNNAIDALEDQPEPRVITISTSVVSSKEQQTNGNGQLTADFVAIRIIDNGLGMSENVQKQIFDPFFTTKAVGRGTGLGLSISYQIVVEKHRGQLHCVSTLGQGTEFIVEIPARR